MSLVIEMLSCTTLTGIWYIDEIDMVIVFYKISINNYKSKEIRILPCTKRSRHIYNNNYKIIIMLKNTVVVSSEEIIPKKYLNTTHNKAGSISTYHLFR